MGLPRRPRDRRDTQRLRRRHPTVVRTPSADEVATSVWCGCLSQTRARSHTINDAQIQSDDPEVPLCVSCGLWATRPVSRTLPRCRSVRLEYPRGECYGRTLWADPSWLPERITGNPSGSTGRSPGAERPEKFVSLSEFNRDSPGDAAERPFRAGCTESAQCRALSGRYFGQ